MDFVRFSFLIPRFSFLVASNILFNFPTIIYLNAIVVCSVRSLSLFSHIQQCFSSLLDYVCWMNEPIRDFFNGKQCKNIFVSLQLLENVYSILGSVHFLFSLYSRCLFLQATKYIRLSFSLCVLYVCILFSIFSHSYYCYYYIFFCERKLKKSKVYWPLIKLHSKQSTMAYCEPT